MKAIVWSRDRCAYCEQAKNLLKSQNIVYEERNIDHGYSREQLLEAVPGARTVPQIFLDDRHIGGFTELRDYLQGARDAI
jgi:glutaredoxin 3